MPFADWRDVHPKRRVAEGSANRQRIVGRPVLQPRIEQQAALIGVAGPKQLHTVLHRFGREPLAEMHPVILRAIADDSDPPHVSRRVHKIVRVEPESAAIRAGHHGNVAVLNPREIVFVARIVMLRRRPGGAHGIIAIAVFDAVAGPNDRLAERRPEVGVVQAKVVTVFMRSGARSIVAVSQMETDAAHKSQPCVARSRLRTGHDVEEIVLRDVESVVRLGDSFASIVEFAQSGVVIVGRYAGQLHDWRHIRSLTQPSEDQFSVRQLVHVVAETAEMPRHLRIRHRISQVTEARPHNQKPLSTRCVIVVPDQWRSANYRGAALGRRRPDQLRV